MKKLFYVVLVVLIVLVIGSFVKKNVDSSAPATDDVIDVVACDCDAECTCAETNENCVCAAQRAACDCDVDADGDGVSEDIEAEEVIEENPEETSHEDETIVSE